MCHCRRGPQLQERRLGSPQNMKMKENQEKARKHTTGEIHEGLEVKVWADFDTS